MRDGFSSCKNSIRRAAHNQMNLSPIKSEAKTKLGASGASVAVKSLSGIVPPMITPLRDRDALDIAGFERLVEHIIGGGVHGLFILDTSGEGPGLSYRLRREVIERVYKQVHGRIPVLVGITDTAFTESIAIACYVADAGAQAVVSAGPYYLPVAQPELLDYVNRLTQDQPLPLFIYNMPQLTKVHFEPETLRQLSHLEKIVGLKDSSADLVYFDKLVALKKDRPDWSVLVGPEHLLTETMRRGGDGGVNGGAKFHPSLFVQLFQAVKSGDAARVSTLQEKLLCLVAIYSVGQHASAVIKGMKCACSLLGICDDLMAEPFEKFRAPERAKIRAVLESLDLLPVGK